MKLFWKRLKHAFSNTPLDGVVVPQGDIDSIEEARKKIYDWAIKNSSPNGRGDLHDISFPIWHLTHNKYPRAI
jgi:hypothetical protein